MFPSLRRRSILLYQVVKTHAPSFSTSVPISAVQIVVPNPGAVTGTLSKATPSPTSLTRLFSVYTRNCASAQAAAKEDIEDVLKAETTGPSSGIPELVKFQDLVDHSLIDRRIMKAIIDDMKFVNMTEVQSKTIRATIAGSDV